MKNYNSTSRSISAFFGKLPINKRISICFLLLTLLALVLFVNQLPSAEKITPQQSFIVQGYDIDVVTKAIEEVGGDITHTLAIINSVGATLNQAQQQQLQKKSEIKALYKDHSINHAHSKDDDKDSNLYPDLNFAERVQAESLHNIQINGEGITVAFIDTGVHHKFKNLEKNIEGENRLLVQYDAINDTIEKKATDLSGHGTHVSSIAIGSNTDSKKQKFVGIAPNANLVSVKAFDEDGIGSYLDVIRALDWIVTNKQKHDIRVLNLSFSASPQSLYWNDPVNQAVMAAWQAGIVVVASAGNTGPDAMTIGVPGNVPYVITVGAMSDNKTADIIDDDKLAIFSSAGPTVEGFVKPDILAPGGRLLGLMDKKTQIGTDYKAYFFDKENFVMSGTSQSTAVVSGVVALMLQQDPSLTPDMVKCHLLASAESAVTTQGELAYSVFQQGAGVVNAYQATYNTESNCANQSLNIALDLDGSQHYSGPARRDENGNYYLVEDEENSQWDGSLSEDGYMWKGVRGKPKKNGLWDVDNIWENGTLWKAGYEWKDGEMYKDGYMWKGVRSKKKKSNVWDTDSMWQDSLSESISINHWVEE